MMRSISLAELQEPLKAKLWGSNQSFSRVVTDSRLASEGDIFLALKGSRHDGHSFLDQVGSIGVPAILNKGFEYDHSWLEVCDTQIALGKLGGFNRKLFAGFLIAITGSSGKTTVKNLVTSVFSQIAPTVGSKGNFNNEVGVPLTLLDISAKHEFAVVEMGAGKVGDIAYLCELARPYAAVALNAMPAHLKGFGDLNAVAKEKGAIYESLPTEGIAIINNDESASLEWLKRATSSTVIGYSIHDIGSDVFASSIKSRGIEGVSFRAITRGKYVDINLKLPGLHNVSNALAAISFGLAFDIDLELIATGIEAVSTTCGRLMRYVSPSGALIIDDSYNANPGSMRAAIDILAECEGCRTLILGSMMELGSDSELLHRKLGKYAKEKGIENLWGLGDEMVAAIESFGEGGRWFQDRSKLHSVASEFFGADDSVLVKGSRTKTMESTVEILTSSQGKKC